MLEFEDVNEAVAHYAFELANSSIIKSSSSKNIDSYKSMLGGEVLQQFFKIKNSRAVLCTFKGHKYHQWWLYSEILSEMLNLDPPLMYKYKPELFSQHYDLLESGRMQYMYGSRWAEFNQLENVYKRLRDNINSKRAVVTIFTPYDTAPERKDAPCTLMYSLIHRDGRLHMTVFYRSWDFFGGFKTYDFALSSFILQSFCCWLNLEPGDLCFYVTSLHFYERDRDKLNDLIGELQGIITEVMSDELVVGEYISMKRFYDELRLVKEAEEAFRNKRFDIEDMESKITVDLFKDMVKCFRAKNGGTV